MVSQKAVVCESLAKRLKNSNEVLRTLIGYVGSGGALHLTGTTMQRSAMPYGQPAIGIYSSKTFDDFENLLGQCAKRVDSFRKNLQSMNLQEYVVLVKDGDGFTAKMVDKGSSTFRDVEIEVKDLQNADGVLLRSKLSLPISIEFSAAQGFFRSNIEKSIKQVTGWLTPESMWFECNGSRLEKGDEISLREWLRKCLERKAEPSGTDKREITLSRILQGNGDDLQSPVINIEKVDGKYFEFGLNLDVVSFCDYDIPATDAANLLTTALRLQASSLTDIIADSVADGQIIPPKPVHYKVDSAYVTCCFVGNTVNAFMKPMLHDDLLVDKTKPRFSAGQSLFFAAEAPVYSSVLMNTHSNVKPPAKASKVATVQGNYLYFHYMQQKFDDAGWGCAYRSLQTLCSWFRLQGYTDVEVPNHKKIQETLVEIGDKESKFIGSKQWIGSQEVSFVLNQLMKIDSKTICASSGSEIPSKVPDLIDHFEKHGTPVMIGGGQLAHTILGVAINEANEETHYLILDPHYTGSEDLHIINGKGWCSWKPATFWDKTSFYNMCLPQVPRNKI